MGRHVALLRHITQTLNQPVFVLAPYCRVFSGEAANTNFSVFGLTRSRLEPTTYHTNHYTTDAENLTQLSISSVVVTIY